MIKALLECEGAPEIFVQAPHFYIDGLNGYQLQMCTYFGRYLSFSALTTETLSWKEHFFNVGLRKLNHDQIMNLLD